MVMWRLDNIMEKEGNVGKTSLLIVLCSKGVPVDYSMDVEVFGLYSCTWNSSRKWEEWLGHSFIQHTVQLLLGVKTLVIDLIGYNHTLLYHRMNRTEKFAFWRPVDNLNLLCLLLYQGLTRKVLSQKKERKAVNP